MVSFSSATGACGVFGLLVAEADAARANVGRPGAKGSSRCSEFLDDHVLKVARLHAAGQ